MKLRIPRLTPTAMTGPTLNMEGFIFLLFLKNHDNFITTAEKEQWQRQPNSLVKKVLVFIFIFIYFCACVLI